MSEFLDTFLTHIHHQLPNATIRPLAPLIEEELNFRVGFLNEELKEFEAAAQDNDLVKMLDALLDIVVVAHGTACFMGITPQLWDEGWKAVTQANRAKVRGQTKRRFHYDLIKPADWVSPEIKLRELIIGILER